MATLMVLARTTLRLRPQAQRGEGQKKHLVMWAQRGVCAGNNILKKQK
jgi:hypothetical protein